MSRPTVLNRYFKTTNGPALNSINRSSPWAMSAASR